MNHLDADEQARVRERPEDYSLRTRYDVAAQTEEAQQAQKHQLEKVGVRDASQRLSRLVWRAQGGETIIITVNGKVSAQLCPVVPRIDAKGGAG